MISKTIKKRYKLTKTGKVLHKACNQDHFNAKDSSKKRKNKRRKKEISADFKKTIKSYL